MIEMIYSLTSNGHLKQGDILRNLPQITSHEIDFETFSPSSPTLRINPKIVKGTILTQSCDIRPSLPILFAEVIPDDGRLNIPNDLKRANAIHQILRQDSRLHYLPPDVNINDLSIPHLINFTNIFSLPYQLIMENIDDYFIARIIDVSRYLLKEKIIHFFTRPAFDDVIYLTDKEIDAILSQNGKKKISITEEEIKRIFDEIGRSYNF